MSGQHERDGFDAETQALPAAGYLPAHDPAVHGHAYTVRYQGHHTQPFTAVESYVPPCRCDDCRYGHNPGADAVLYAGDDAVYLMERAAIRDGRYEDAEAFGARVYRGVHADFDAHHEHVRQTLSRAAAQIAQIRGAA